MTLLQGSFMTDEEIVVILWNYDEFGFDDLPSWLKQELKARNLSFGPRQPTPQEIEETKLDALEHRIFNNEMTIEDYHDLYVKGTKINVQRRSILQQHHHQR